MKSAWQTLHKVSSWLHLPELPNWLLGLLALVMILRIPSFFEPYYYGDEMIYMSLGQGVRQGLTLYKDIHDNKPPLIYLGAAAAGSLVWFKVILAFWSIATIVLFYKLADVIFEKNKRTKEVATIVFGILTTLPLLEGNTVNAELFMIGPTILAFLMLLRKNLPTPKEIFISGLLFGIATLFKVPAAFEMGVVVFYWIIIQGIKNYKQIFKNTCILVAGFAIPILLTLIWYFFKGALPEYIKAAFLSNIGYLSSWRSSVSNQPFLIKNAPLIVRGLIVLVGCQILYIFSNRLSKKFIFICLWLLFTLFAVTLSERPYPHYLIQSLPSISLLVGMFFVDKTLEQSLTVLPLTLAVFVPFYYKFWLYPTGSYYSRFISLVTRQETKNAYIASFGQNVRRNYDIAKFLMISSKKSDRVFMWDPDSPSVYALSRRLPPIKYVADYHVYDYSSKKEVARELAKSPPKFIILTSDHPFTELNDLLENSYLPLQKIGNATIYVKIDL